MRQYMSKGLVACLALSLAACGSPASPGGGSVSAGEMQDERYCSIEGFESPERHTYILLDESAYSKTEDPAEFRNLNGGMLDLVLNFADPKRALASGTAAPRERVSIFVLPRTGAVANRIFTGCIPGFSAEEEAAARSENSAVRDFFTGGRAQELSNDQDGFQTQLIGAIRVAAQSAPGPAEPAAGPVLSAPLVSSLKASGRLINAETGLPRVLIYTDVTNVETADTEEVSEIREQGIAMGEASGIDLGRSEILMVQDNPGSDLQREFFDAFFLMQQGDLQYWGSARVGALDAPATKVERYIGEALYPGAPQTVQIRIGTDANGKLVNSWMILRGRPDRATPMTGQLVCQAGKCRIASDGGGFAQAWSPVPGGTPEFLDDIPFSGLRDFEFSISDGELQGRVFDPAVGQVGLEAGNDSIPVSGSLQDNATF